MVAYRPQLHSEVKLVMHERALAMGTEDPLKPDYSRFLPKKRRRVLSNIVPLEHGHLANLREYDLVAAEKAALAAEPLPRAAEPQGGRVRGARARPSRRPRRSR